ncbi:MAG: protein kinase, partial [Candidatus Hydrogenedentes bacterium]|nr:protein kinase [Candidatus Hydrogenedentota bacterium]
MKRRLMALKSGSRLGVFEIGGILGAGAMGEVYRARDTKLGREVAIKVLPEAFAKDPERLARFEREAQMLAALNHPNIGALYDFQTGRASVPASREDAGENAARGYARPPETDAPEIHFLVLELVEGETLAVRIARGPMPVDEALPI